MSSFGFTSENTPGEGVREFYRLQGVARERARALQIVNELQADTDGAVFEVLSWVATLIERGEQK